MSDRSEADAREADAREADAREADAREADAREADAREVTRNWAERVREDRRAYAEQTLVGPHASTLLPRERALLAEYLRGLRGRTRVLVLPESDLLYYGPPGSVPQADGGDGEASSQRVIEKLKDPFPAVRKSRRVANVAKIDELLAKVKSRPPKEFDPKAPMPF